LQKWSHRYTYSTQSTVTTYHRRVLMAATQ